MSEPPPRERGGWMGRYRLAYELATGGMATLYLAIADSTAGFGKAVALKRIHPHLAREESFREMFLDEARLAALLQHPNVCGVLDYGEQDGLPFFTMEYLVGEPLSRVLRALEKRCPDGLRCALPNFAARVVADAARGLHAAHELCDPNGNPMHLVHRDVSPHNVFVNYDGVTRVVDFGIARTRTQEHHTATGTVKGKFAYMAPEQMLGEDLDRRADVWSLGVVLWELLAVRRLFKRKTEMETVLAVTQEPITDVRKLNPNVADELARILDRALARDISARYNTSAEMARDLERYLVRDADLFGANEAAEWMRVLFPTGEQRKRLLMAEALSKRSDESIEQRMLAESESGSLELVSDSRVRATTSDRAPERTSDEFTGTSPRRERNRGALFGALATIAIASVAAVAFFAWPRPASPETPRIEGPSERTGEPASGDRASLELATSPQQATVPVTAPAVVPSAPAAPEPAPAVGPRWRRPRNSPAPTASAAPVAPAPTPSPAAQPEPTRQGPMIVESLELGPSGPARTPSRPLIVEDLDLDGEE